MIDGSTSTKVDSSYCSSSQATTAIIEPANDLFRLEALQASSGEWLGDIQLAVPLSHRFWLVSSLIIGALIVSWLFLGHYTRRERVDGVLIPERGLLAVTARSVGTVFHLHVAEGDFVKVGAPLLTVSNERSSVALGDSTANISKQLSQQKERLKLEMENAAKLAGQQANDLRMQQSMLHNQIQQLDAQISIEQRRAGRVSEILKKIEPLTQNGFVSELEVQQEESQELEAEGQVRALTRDRYETERQLLQIADQRSQLPLTTQAKISDLQGQISQLEQTLNTNEADRETIIRASEDGVVSSILIKPGQSVATGSSLLAIVPTHSILQAQLLVPTKAIGFVRIGTSVAMHYQAFPFQKFGVQRGTVVSVSKSALTPEEVTELVGEERPKEPMFRVIVALSAQTVNAYGHPEMLKPSMAIDADLLLDSRPVVEWIFEPLYGMGKRFFGSGT